MNTLVSKWHSNLILAPKNLAIQYLNHILHQKRKVESHHHNNCNSICLFQKICYIFLCQLLLSHFLYICYILQALNAFSTEKAFSKILVFSSSNLQFLLWLDLKKRNYLLCFCLTSAPYHYHYTRTFEFGCISFLIFLVQP